MLGSPVPSAGGTAAQLVQPSRHRPHPVQVFEKHTFFTRDHGVAHPSGATYLEGTKALAVAETRPGTTVVRMLDPRSDSVVGRARVTVQLTPGTLADNGRGRLAGLSGNTFVSWPATGRGVVNPVRRAITGASVSRVRALTFDPVTRAWLGLDPVRHELVELRVRGRSVQASTTGRVAGLGGHTPAGVAYDSATRRVYVADPAASRPVPVDSTGKQVAPTLDISDVRTTSLRSLVFGATADPTDPPSATSLYVTDAGDRSTYGRVAEVSLTPLGQAAAAAPSTSSARLVRQSMLSKLRPPSPDPSGIVHMKDRDRLLVADSEVDEMSIYQGVNLWQISRDDTVTFETSNTGKFTNEPTGVAYDPARQRMFVSSDTKVGVVYESGVGSDGRLGTADDPVTSFATGIFGDADPEDLTFDTKSGDLFVAQGIGQEVWRVSAGRDGLFKGIAPSGDDVVSHFDVGIFGITDLEGLGYSPGRDTVFLADRHFTKVIEVTKTGALVQTIDVAGINMLYPASITLAPATDDPTRTDLFLTTRGVDNNTVPTENDGMMYELTAPNLGPAGAQANHAPAVDAGPDMSSTQPSATALHGSVTDDGLPDPPAATNATWATVSGPGTVTFASATTADTTATFSAPGTYVLRLTGSDSALTTADDVTVVVNQALGVNTSPTVNAGADQTLTLPSLGSLNAAVNDDGLPKPPAATTVTWSKVSGPGTVVFSAPTAASTTASFSTSGTYVVRASASDSSLTGSDEVSVVVMPEPSTGNLVGNPGFGRASPDGRGRQGRH